MANREKWKYLMQELQDLRNQGEYRSALRRGKAAIKLAEHLPVTDLTLTLNNLAGLYKSLERYEEAEPLYLRALAIRTQQLGREHPDVATSLNNLAVLCKAQRRFGEAQHLYQQAINILEHRLGNDHPSVANTLHNLAGLHRSQKQYAEAEPLYRRALVIREQKLGSNHPTVASTLNNLAGLCEVQGRYAEAAPLYRRALAIAEFSTAPSAPTILQTDSLATDSEQSWSTTNLDPAAPGESSALAVRAKSLGNDTADSLYSLAILCKSQGRYAEAEQHYLRALAICEQQLGTEHSAIASLMDGLASLCASQGWYTEAEQYYLRAMMIYEQQLGSEHPAVLNSLNQLAELHYDQGWYAESLQYYQSLLIAQYNSLRHQLLAVNEAEHHLHLQNIQYTLDIILSLVANHLQQDATACASALAAVLRAKMLGATTTAARNALSYSHHYRQLHPQLQRLHTLIIQSQELDYDHPARADLEQQISQVEEELTQAAPEIMLREATLIDPPAIALVLPTDSTLVEFIKFNPYDFEHKTWGEANYLGLILPQAQPDRVQMAVLGTAATIEELIPTFRQTVNLNFSPAEYPEAEQVPTQLIGSLLPYLHSPHLIIAPDANLFHLPFNLLLPEHTVTYLTTGRDLLRHPSSRPASESAVIIDPDFDDPDPKFHPVLPSATELLASEDLGKLFFPPLENYGLLGRSIAHKLTATEYSEQAATKTTMTSSCPHVLGVLTHGFALEPLETSAGSVSRAGLAFSGANLDKNNLLLTSEIAALDLHSNDLTVLVVCGTAPDNIQHGDGIHELRRAFMLAGAKTTIANLWSVPVLVSVVLLERFFDNLHHRRMDKGAALAAAQNYLRTCPREELRQSAAGRRALAEVQAANFDDGQEYPFARPYFWAAWVCQGDPGSMEYTTIQRLGVVNISGKAVNLRLKA